MKKSPFSLRLTVLTVGVLMLVLTGCGGTTAPARFYVLSPLVGAEKGVQALRDESRISIGIGPVEVAQYLDRPQIVTRLSPNELKLADFDHWGEPLKDNFSRVLTENLLTLLSAEPIAVFPLRGPTKLDYRVEVEVMVLDGDLGGKAELVARWAIFRDEDRQMLFTKKSSLSEAAGGGSYEAFVSAQSRAVEALSREIAKAIKDIL